MPKTGAERQAAYRQRRAEAAAVLEAEAGRLRADVAGLRAELGTVRGQLAAARDESERLAGRRCKHPAEAMDGGTCRACGTEVW
jgi:hypothetical protein